MPTAISFLHWQEDQQGRFQSVLLANQEQLAKERVRTTAVEVGANNSSQMATAIILSVVASLVIGFGAGFGVEDFLQLKAKTAAAQSH